jgi:hypothetical protein
MSAYLGVDGPPCACVCVLWRLCAVIYFVSALVACPQAGVTTDEIDAQVHKWIIDAGAYPSPLTYGVRGRRLCTDSCSTDVHCTPQCSEPLSRHCCNGHRCTETPNRCCRKALFRAAVPLCRHRPERANAVLYTHWKCAQNADTSCG